MEFEIEAKYLDTPEQNSPITLYVLDAKTLSYQNFLHNYMLKNVPCLIKNIANKWEATEKWVTNGKPNLNYLGEKYDRTKVVIYNCSERYFNSQRCREDTLANYLELWKEKQADNLYYLKDWHLKLQCKTDNFYEVPIYFASDWLNEYYIHCTQDDYRFVYMGQQGTWTPLHVDVFNSYSWSVNICGLKRWIFFPPSEEIYLKDELNNILYDVENIYTSRQHIEVVQEPGEAIFVPSNWFHQVWNLEDTISINHNWVNGCNINTMWKSLRSNLEVMKKEIDDCKEMDNFEEHCQTMLRALFGMNYKDFYDFLQYIAKQRLEMLNNLEKRLLFHGHTIGINHILFDLSQAHKVLEDFLNCDDVHKTDYYSNGQSLLNKIVESLKSSITYS